MPSVDDNMLEIVRAFVDQTNRGSVKDELWVTVADPSSFVYVDAFGWSRLCPPGLHLTCFVRSGFRQKRSGCRVPAVDRQGRANGTQGNQNDARSVSNVA